MSKQNSTYYISIRKAEHLIDIIYFENNGSRIIDAFFSAFEYIILLIIRTLSHIWKT